MEKKPMAVRFAKTEFEVDGGRIFPYLMELDDIE